MTGGRRILSILGSLVALVATAASVAHAAGAPTALPPTSPADAQKLSDEQLITRWSYPERRAQVFAAPSSQARMITRLRLLTEDGFPELYVVLSQWKDPRGSTWLKVRIPGRPNGRTGWVVRNAVGELYAVHTRIVVDKRRLRLTLYDSGKAVFSARVGIGKSSTPTPSGHFWVREKFRVRGTTIYGPRAIGTSAYAPTLTDWPGGGVVGLHGTNEPQLIPGRPSHGCIRLKNRDILRLYRLAPRGTPIDIH